MKYKLKLAVLVAVSLGIAACGGGRSSADISSDLREIRGTDTNGNGVRDDVEAKIRAKFSKDPAKMQAWLQFADALTDVLEAGYLGNMQTIRKAYKELDQAISCEVGIYSNMGQAYDDRKYVKALVINTRLRRDAGMAYGQALDGTIIRSSRVKNLICPQKNEHFFVNFKECSNKRKV